MYRMIKYLTLIILFLINVTIPASLDGKNNTILSDDEQKDTFLAKSLTDNSDLNDGPYLFIHDDNLIEKTVVNGEIKTRTLDLQSKKIDFKPEKAIYKNVEQIAALSDLHGQYELTIKILKNNGIIDDDLKWNFGKGHLVVVGDVFDRGDKVTEILWFLFNLEKEAKESGGKLHYLMGNHEYMVLRNDLRYIDEKYQKISKLIDTPYNELYNNQTILGRWLRSKPTVIKINDDLFVHAGISKKFSTELSNLDSVNQFFRKYLDTKKSKGKTKLDKRKRKYFGGKGPVWFRGYFNDSLNDPQVSGILNKLKVNHIIVGHTSQKEILPLYSNKIIAVDSSIKYGEYGELLLIDNGSYYRCTMDGVKSIIEEAGSHKK